LENSSRNHRLVRLRRITQSARISSADSGETPPTGEISPRADSPSGGISQIVNFSPLMAADGHGWWEAVSFGFHVSTYGERKGRGGHKL
jgi:hypothetical protein